MMKRLAAIAAMSLVAFQAVSGVAVGATAHLGSGLAPVVGASSCGLGAVLGTWTVSANNDVTFAVDSTDNQLDCWVGNYAGGPTKSVDLADVDRVIVSASDNTGVADITFDLSDGAASPYDLVDFEGIEFSVRVEGTIYIDGDEAEDRDDFEVTLEDDAFSVDEAGLDATVVYALTYNVTGGFGDDVIDGKKVTAVGFTAAGDAGDDVIYGGSGDDTLDCGDDNGAYSEDTNGDPDGFLDQCWGGDGDDYITIDEDVVAPGDGEDDIMGYAIAVTYVDSTAGVVINADDGETESDAGDDDFDSDVESWTGSAKADEFNGTDGNDVFVGGGGADVAYGGDGNDSLSGGAGNDRLWGGAGSDVIRGGAGDDVLKGGSGTDRLRGDAGSDEAWGGKNKDACGAEVTDSCEFSRI